MWSGNIRLSGFTEWSSSGLRQIVSLVSSLYDRGKDLVVHMGSDYVPASLVSISTLSYPQATPHLEKTRVL
jgi:hypothetical protein